MVVMRLRRGPLDAFEVGLSDDQLKSIVDEFRGTPEWSFFLDYCQASADPRSKLPVSAYSDHFTDRLEAIIAQHTEYHVPLLWPVIDAIRAATVGRDN